MSKQERLETLENYIKVKRESIKMDEIALNRQKQTLKDLIEESDNIFAEIQREEYLNV